MTIACTLLHTLWIPRFSCSKKHHWFTGKLTFVFTELTSRLHARATYRNLEKKNLQAVTHDSIIPCCGLIQPKLFPAGKVLSIVEWSVCQRPGLSKVCTTHCLYNSSATSERAFSTCTEKAFTYLRSSMTEQRLWVTVQLCTSTRIFLTKWTWTWLFKPLQQQMRKWDDILAPFSFWFACIELLHGFFQSFLNTHAMLACT